MRKTTLAFLALLTLAVATLLGAPAQASTSWLSGHIQNAGWVDAHPSASHPDATTVGTTGQSLRLEALRLNAPAEAPFTARAHVQNLGWIDQHQDSLGRTVIGTTGQSLRLEAVQLTPAQPDSPWVVWCEAHVQDIGWMRPVRDGETCGTTGRALRLEAVRIWIEPR